MPHLEAVRAEEIDLDQDQLDVAYKLLRQWTDQGHIPGGAILVGRRGKIVETKYFGRQGPEPDAPPIQSNGIFLLASISKPVTYLGAMLLVERGLLNLSDHVTRYIPDFAAHHKEDTLVAHLFTHTSGMPDMLPDNEELRREHAPLSRFIQGAIRDTVPLFPPGSDLSYQSMGTLVVAELVQRISGLSIAEHLKKEIFQPLGLRSTALGSQGLLRDRIVRVETPKYQAGSDFGWNSTYWQEFGAPWGGMFSTPEDFAVICQMLLDGGRYGDGEDDRLLSPGAVRMMTTNRLDDFPDLPEPIRRAKPWGLGWRMNHPGNSDSWGDLLDRNVFGHTGATGTMVWMDRQRDGFCILFTSGIRSKAPWRLVHVSNAIAASFV
jgi:CubicO group peptidase (beta-lactamase class C family)